MSDELPAWINRESWDGFLDMRKAIKHPLTEHGKKLALKQLARFRDEGADPNAILDQSTFHSWQGLFELITTAQRVPRRGSPPAREEPDVRHSVRKLESIQAGHEAGKALADISARDKTGAIRRFVQGVTPKMREPGED